MKHVTSYLKEYQNTSTLQFNHTMSFKESTNKNCANPTCNRYCRTGETRCTNCQGLFDSHICGASGCGKDRIRTRADGFCAKCHEEFHRKKRAAARKNAETEADKRLRDAIRSLHPFPGNSNGTCSNCLRE